MARCGFKTDIKYYDETTGYVLYSCPEPEENILPSGLCIFHDENYLKESKHKKANEQNLKREFSKKLDEAGPLICIGYHLPDFSFAQRHFAKSVNFSGATFMGLTDFSKAQFSDFANFYGAKFTNEVDFSKAQFTKESNFSNAQLLKKPISQMQNLRMPNSRELNLCMLTFTMLSLQMLIYTVLNLRMLVFSTLDSRM